MENSYVELKRQKELNKLRSGKSVPSVVLTVIAVIFLLLALGKMSYDRYTALTYCGVGFILLIAGIIFGAVSRGSAKRINAYEMGVNKNGNTPIANLAAAAGRRDLNKACEDLQMMIARGFFPGAYIDRDNMMLVMTADGKPKEFKGLIPKTLDDLLVQTNDDEIKGKLTTLKGLTDKIDAKVEAKADASQTLKKQVKEFKEQYFPAILKMTNNYNTNIEQFDGTKEIRAKLLELIDSVIEASENLIERLNEQDIMDITTDIQSLQTTLATRGLLDSDFDIKL